MSDETANGTSYLDSLTSSAPADQGTEPASGGSTSYLDSLTSSTPPAEAKPQSDWWQDYWGPLAPHASQAFASSSNGQPAAMPASDPFTTRNLLANRTPYLQDIQAGSLADADSDSKERAAQSASRLAQIDHVLGVMGQNDLAQPVANSSARDMISSLDHPKLMSSQRYREVYNSALPVLGESDAQAYAKQTIAQQAHDIPYLRDGIMGDLMGMPDDSAFRAHYPEAVSPAIDFVPPEGRGIEGSTPDPWQADTTHYTPVEYAENLAEATRGGLRKAAGGLLQMVGEAPQVLGNELIPAYGGTPEAVQPNTLSEAGAFEHAKGAQEQEVASGHLIPEPGAKDSFVSKIPYFAQSLVEGAPQLFMGASAMGLSAAGDKYGEARANGEAPDIALKTSGVDGAVNYLAGKLLLDATVGKEAVAGMGGLAKSTGTGATVNLATEAANIYNEKYVEGKDVSADEVKQRLANAFESGVVQSSALHGAGMAIGAGEHGAQAVAEEVVQPTAEETATPEAASTEQAAEAIVGAPAAPEAMPPIVRADDAKRAALQQTVNEHVQAGRYTPEQAQAVMENMEPARRDQLTGLLEKEHHDDAIARAQDWVQQTGQPAQYMTFDLRGINALNAAKGHTATNTDIAALANIVKEEAGPHSELVRNGGDEIAGPVYGITPEEAQALRDRVEQRGAAYSTSIGADQIKNPKYPDQFGTGIVGHTAEITPGTAVHEIASNADYDLERRKENGPGTRVEAGDLRDATGIAGVGGADAEGESGVGRAPTGEPEPAATSAAERPGSENSGDGEPVKVVRTPVGEVHVETAAGQERSGANEDGTPWTRIMRHDYGYLKGVPGRDGGSMDVLLGENPENPVRPVFVIDQKNGAGEFDEHKVLVGFKNQRDAERAYLSEYPRGWQGMGAVHQMSGADFRAWAATTGREEAHVGKVAPDVPRVTLRNQQSDAVSFHGVRRDDSVNSQHDAIGNQAPRLSLPNATNHLRDRTYFDQATAGGGEGHESVLNNLYDLDTDPRNVVDRAREKLVEHGLPEDHDHMANEVERQIVADGFDGYKAGDQAVTLGGDVPVREHPNEVEQRPAEPEQVRGPAQRGLVDEGAQAAERAEPGGNAARHGEDQPLPWQSAGNEATAEGVGSGARQREPIPREPQGRERAPEDSGGLTSIRNADVDVQREARGAEQLTKRPVSPHQASIGRAHEALQNDPTHGQKLALDLIEKPRAPSQDETAVLQIENRRLSDAYKTALDEGMKAMKGGDRNAEINARVRMREIEEEWNNVERAGRLAGSEWGRSGGMRALAVDKDNVLHSLATAKMKNGGELSAAQRKMFEDLHAELDRLKADAAQRQDNTGRRPISAKLRGTADEKFSSLADRLRAIKPEEHMTKECAL